MTARPDAAVLRAFLERASRRLAWTWAAEGAAAGLALALALSLVGWPAHGALTRALVVGVALAVAGIVVRLWAVRSRSPRVAYLVERRGSADHACAATTEAGAIATTSLQRTDDPVQSNGLG